jgi:hypothetical protein
MEPQKRTSPAVDSDEESSKQNVWIEANFYLRIFFLILLIFIQAFLFFRWDIHANEILFFLDSNIQFFSWWILVHDKMLYYRSFNHQLYSNFCNDMSTLLTFQLDFFVVFWKVCPKMILTYLCFCATYMFFWFLQIIYLLSFLIYICYIHWIKPRM